MRFIRAACLVALLAGAFAGAAAALDFNDEGDHAPIGEVGKVYHFELPSHGGCDYAPYHYVVESGALPPGLKIGLAVHQNLVGLIDGIPTEAGVYRAWIALKDVCGNSAELLFTFDIWVRRWGIATSGLKAATVGAAYSATLEAQGVPSTTKWEVSSGSLPAGLTLSAEGTISGTPSAVGSSTFTVKATGEGKDFSGTRVDSKEYTLSVLEPLAAKVSRRAAEIHVPFRATLAGAGGQAPYTWSASGLPAGLAVDSAGSISGTPTRIGSFPAQITVTDANGNSKAASVRFTVARGLVITTKSLRSATVGSAYRARLTVRWGVPPVRWSIVRGQLPAGLALNARTGTIAGTARVAGSGRVTIRAKDAAGGISRRTLVVSALG
jgi:hypothetical protein